MTKMVTVKIKDVSPAWLPMRMELSLNKDGDRQNTKYFTSIGFNKWSSVLVNMVTDQTQDILLAW